MQFYELQKPQIRTPASYDERKHLTNFRSLTEDYPKIPQTYRMQLATTSQVYSLVTYHSCFCLTKILFNQKTECNLCGHFFNGHAGLLIHKATKHSNS